jgi:outer membrane receptor for ferrienterochelin and colicin
MKNFLLITLLTCCQLALAQGPPAGGGNPSQPAVVPGPTAPRGNGKITGTVVDSTTQQPVPFATVALTDPASNKPLDGTVADDKGQFTIAKVGEGTYQVLISFIGYQTKTVANVRIGDKRDDVNLGNIRISPTVQLLQEITVQGQRALVEEKVDRTVYNAEVDETNKGGDATDVLRKVPMLSVDLDGNVSLRGSQNIRVLINNRPSTITAGSIADALKQIPSDLIKSVEVITSPSAKYDAEGSGGIINIITKKNTLEGFSLNVDGSAGIRGSNLGLNGSLRKGKMGFSLGGHGRYGYNIKGSFENSQRTINYDSLGNEIIRQNFQQADTRNEFLFGRYTLGWDYDINKYNFLSASVQYGARNRNTFQDRLFTETYTNDEFDSSLRNVDVSDLSGTVDVNLNYTRTFEKPQREFSILTQYSRNKQTNNFVNNILNQEDLLIESRLKNINDSYNQEITVQMDYQTPISKNQMLEIGAKDIIRNVTSEYEYLRAEGAEGAYAPIANDSLSNRFNYNQNITAAYFSYTFTLPKSYTLKAGTRYEYTTINANFQNSDSPVEIPSYGVLVPSVNLSKKLKNGNTLKLAYNRRIQRPSLQFLNPNIQASNPLNQTVGNPDLRPEFTNNFELGYSTFIKGTSLNLSTFVRNTNNSIGPIRSTITDTEGNGVIRTTYQNVGREDAYGFSVFTNVNISNKFTLNGGTDVYYAVLNNNDPNPVFNASNQGFVYNVRGFGNYTLGKGWGVQLFGFYRGRQVQLQGYQGGFGIYSLSLRRDLAQKKGSIGFGAENFFTTSIKMRNELDSPLLTQRSVNTMRNMNFKVNFSYRIGKLNANDGSRRRRKSVNNDDLKSGGDSGQDGAAPATGGNGQGGAPASGGQGQGQRPAGGNGQAPQGARPTQTPNQAPSNAPRN